MTNNIYAVFNGVDAVKSAEFTGFRGPIHSQYPLAGLTSGRRINSDDFHCAPDGCIIFDFVLTTYTLDLSLDGRTFDDSILFGMEQVALISEEKLGLQVRATKIVRPHQLVVGQFLSISYMLIAFLTFAIASFYLWFFAPMESQLWKAKESFLLALIAASVYMESETLLYYIQGDGLMYTPVFTVTLLLAYLPFTLLVILTLRCYTVTHYLSKWKTTSYYKIYPVQMAVLLASTIFHDLPEVITLYFYYTRYKPPSFDVRLTTLIQPVLAVCVAFIQLFTQTAGMLQYQKLFRNRVTKIIIYLSVLPIILVTPLVKISGMLFLHMNTFKSFLVLLSTVFNQLITFTTGASFDPKVHKLIDVSNTSDIVVEILDNEYIPKTIDWLEGSILKSWFRVRSSNCVKTTIAYQNSYPQRQYIIVSQPNPFQDDCLNDVEWILVGCIPTFVIGIASLLFLGRKAWPFLNFQCIAFGLCPRDDSTYARRPSHFVRNIIANMANMFKQPPALSVTQPYTRQRRVRFVDDPRNSVLEDRNRIKICLINEVPSKLK